MKATLVLCACLHIILVLIYVTILVLVKAGVFNAPLNLSEDAARTIVTFVTQGFTIVSTILKVTVQCIDLLLGILRGTRLLRAARGIVRDHFWPTNTFRHARQIHGVARTGICVIGHVRPKKDRHRCRWDIDHYRIPCVHPRGTHHTPWYLQSSGRQRHC